MRNYRWQNTQDPIKLDLRLRIKNFGPISKGSIHVKPLTIFIGDNNSGKSYTAMLIHSILQTESYMHVFSEPFLHEILSNYMKILNFDEKKLAEIIKKNEKKKEFFMPKSLMDGITMALTKMLQQNLKEVISKNFGSPVNELITMDQKSSKIEILNHPKTTITIKKNIRLNIKLNSDIRYKICTTSKTDNVKREGNITTIGINKEFHSGNFINNLITLLVREVIGKILHVSYLDSCYFPSSRSGIIQGYKALTSGMIKKAIPTEIEIPNLTGIVTDFISRMLNISDRKMKFYDVGSDLENKLFHGKIQMKNSKIGEQQEINYHLKKSTIPLHRASSTISEIAPISLYLKHVISSNSILIIEEPEAHLHPANQKIFAKYIVRMIRGGLNVLLTTHSPILLEELGKYMRSDKLNPKERKMLKWDEDDYLKFEEVSPYVFERLDKIHHNINPIETDKEYGIPQDEFVRVTEDLYDEAIKLQDILDKK